MQPDAAAEHAPAPALGSDSQTSSASAAAAAETKGRHRILTELKRLDSEARFLEEDLEKLERTEMVSAIMQELLNGVEKRPDPLLPITTGPVNPAWDQWFEGPQNLHGRRCCIM